MVPISYSVRNVVARKASSLSTAVGVALVVLVMGGTQMINSGVQRALVRTGRADQVILLRTGADAEMSSAIDRSYVPLIAESPAVKRDDRGKPEYVAEISMVLSMPKRSRPDELANVQLRGVPSDGFAFHQDVHVVAGRRPRAGTDEVLLGRQLWRRFVGFELGEHFPLNGRREATVVGVFEASGSAFESEAWADIETIGSCFGRAGIVTSITLRLADPTAWRDAIASIEADRRFGLKAMRQDTYYEKQSNGTITFVSALGGAIVFSLAFAAAIGAMVALLSTAQQRRREIGVLRALGFSPASVLLSFLVEAMTLSLLGALIGCVGCVILSAFDFSILNTTTWSQLSFELRPSPGMLLGATVNAVCLGLIGGLFPAWRAARVSPIQAIRRA